MAIIMILSGLRRGKLAALEWSDIDLEAHTISVSKVIEYDADGLPHWCLYPKTAAGRRVVNIPQKLVTYLKTLPRSEGQPLVIPSTKRWDHDRQQLDKALAVLYSEAQHQVWRPD